MVKYNDEWSLRKTIAATSSNKSRRLSLLLPMSVMAMVALPATLEQAEKQNHFTIRHGT